MNFRFRLMVFAFLIHMPGIGTAQGWVWLERAGDQFGEELGGLDLSPDGTIWTSGWTNGDLANPGQISSPQDQDLFVVKFGNSGSALEILQGGSSSDDSNGGIVSDPSGNTFFAGRYWDEVIFPGLNLQPNQGSASALYVVKTDQNAIPIWGISLDGTGLKVINDLAIANDGSLYITGYFGGSLYTDCSELAAGGITDLFVIKLSADGECLWAKRAGKERDVRATSISIDPWGNVYVGGWYEGAFDFAGGSFVNNTVDHDAFLIKYNPDGQEIWGKKGGGVHDDDCTDIVCDLDGNIYVSGNFIGVFIFQPIEIQTQGFNTNIFLSKLDSSGSAIWSKSIGGTGQEYVSSIDVNHAQLGMTGYFNGMTNIEGNILNTDPVKTDGFLAFFDVDGNIENVEQFGGSGYDLPRKVLSGSASDWYVSGIFEGTSYFDSDSIVSFGGYDIFLAKWGISTSITQTHQESVALHIFPNPVHDILTIQLTAIEKIERIRIRDISGRLVNSFSSFPQNSTGMLQFSVQNLVPGIYILEILGDGLYASEKFIRN